MIKKAKSKDNTFKLLVDGQKVSGNYGVASIVVHKCVNKVPVAQVMILDGDASKQDFKASSSADFKPGAKMTIRIGNVNDPMNPERTIYEGRIIRHGIKTIAKKPSMLVLELRDIAVGLTIARHDKYLTDGSDSDAISTLVRTAAIPGLSVNVEPIPPPEDKKIVQYYSTDWDFICSRADANGMLVFVENGAIAVKKPSLSAPVETFTYGGGNVLEFEAEVDVRDQYKSVKAEAWDPTIQDFASGTGSVKGQVEAGGISSDELAGVFNIDFPLRHTGKLTAAELENWASSKLTRSKLAKIRGRLKTFGFSKIKPGDTILIEKFSDQFNGRIFVSEVRHQYTATSSWYTDIQFGLSQEWFSHSYPDVVDAPAAGLVPGINGLQIGIVSKIDGDPLGLDRVKVKIPVISKQNEGIWARVSTLDAGKADKQGEGRASFFRPEVDDEVIVGFLNDDPREPVILGMVNNTKKPAPLTAESANKEKGFITRSKIRLLFNDADKTLTIETPGENESTKKKNSIVLSQKDGSIVITQITDDSTKNKIEMKKDGISLTSDKDIKITAKKGKIELTAKEIKAEATTSLTASGNTAEVSAKTTTTIKGTSSVMIN
jgi:Rhs element Vgr protein